MSSGSGPSWFQSAGDRSPPAFFVAFDIYVKQHGHQRYMQAIEQSNLDKHTKLDLLQKFSYWKVNDGIQFWLDRQSQSSQIRTASTLVKGSESYAEDSIHRTRKMNFGDVEGTEVEDTHFPNPVFEPETRFSTQKEIEEQLISESPVSSLLPTRVLLKRGRTSESGTASKTARHDYHRPPEYDVNDGIRTPPLNVQGHYEEIPLAADLEAVFRHVDISTTFLLRETDKGLYDDASKWFKAKIRTSTELTISEMKKTRFQEDWIHDLLYDRLKLLRTGLNPNADENTYTSFWVSPDFFALQTGVQGLISSGFINENHFGPSAWRRSLARGTQSSKGTNVDAYFLARDEYVDILFENIGPPSCTNHSKHHDDKEKTWRNAADALLERFYNTSGSFEIAKGYKIVCVIVFGYDVAIYTVNILNRNEYLVKKVFQDKYHVRRDVYLAKLLVHLKICLTIKTIMEDNWDVCVEFGNSIESTEKDEQAHFNLKIHTTPVKAQISPAKNRRTRIPADTL